MLLRELLDESHIVMSLKNFEECDQFNRVLKGGRDGGCGSKGQLLVIQNILEGNHFLKRSWRDKGARLYVGAGESKILGGLLSWRLHITRFFSRLFIDLEKKEKKKQKH